MAQEGMMVGSDGPYPELLLSIRISLKNTSFVTVNKRIAGNNLPFLVQQTTFANNVRCREESIELIDWENQKAQEKNIPMENC